MSKQQIVLLAISGVGLTCLAFSFVLPFASIAVSFASVDIASSLWHDFRILSIILALAFVALAAVPIFHPKHRSWLFPLFGSIPLIAVGLLILGFHFIGGAAYMLLTVILFTVAGLMLLCEALIVKKG